MRIRKILGLKNLKLWLTPKRLNQELKAIQKQHQAGCKQSKKYIEDNMTTF